MTEIIKILLLLIMVVVIGKFVFSTRKAKVLFEMEFKQGRMVKHQGKIQDKFNRECRALVKQEKLTCLIRAECLHSVRLHVSHNVSQAVTQRIRNIFPFEYYEKKIPDSGKKVG